MYSQQKPAQGSVVKHTAVLSHSVELHMTRSHTHNRRGGIFMNDIVAPAYDEEQYTALLVYLENTSDT